MLLGASVQKVFLTGGAGFIGSHVAEALVGAGHQVVILDDLSSGRKENVPAHAELHVMDVRSEAAARLLRERRVEILVHHAAQMDIRRSVEDPRFDADVNILGLLNLLEAARRGGVRQVVFASTGGAIYGEQEAHPADEAHPERPVSPYGVSKLASERYLYFYHRQYGLDATCLRYANVYGPRQNPHGEAGVVAIFLHRLLRGEQPVINGDGRQTRDYAFVADVVRANLAALGRSGFAVYNVGTGVETDVNSLFAVVHRAAGCGPAAVHGPAKPGEQQRSSISSALLELKLGVTVTTSLEHGIAATAAWFVTQHRRAS
jgi:UDP-glucose 4-epimerase